MSDLARRAVACKGWRWMPGMLADEGWRFLQHTESRDYWVEEWKGEWTGVLQQAPWEHSEPYGGFLPDLEDPATLGCLLALVREAHGSPLLGVLPCYVSGGGVIWQTDHPYPDACPFAGTHATEAEALVAALEAAP